MRLTKPGVHTVANRIFAVALLCLGVGATAYGILHVTFGPRPVEIHVRWALPADDTIRQEAERRYRLSQGAPVEGRTWSYALSDLSRPNVRALVSDPAIEDTHDIERTTFRVSPAAPRRPYLTSYAWVPVSLVGVTVLCMFVGLFGISVGLIERGAPGAAENAIARFAAVARFAGHPAMKLRLSLVFVILSGALTASFRFLTIHGFINDHFVHLTAAQQMMFGDWPTRDFIDLGRPLQIVASAAAQHVFGHTLFAEALLVSAGFGAAAALTSAIVFSLTGSLIVSFGAVVLEVAALPRTYSYSKLFATAAGLWLIGRFLRRPSFARLVMMAGGVTIAFLFRHDLGLFVGVGGLVASILAAPAAPWKERCRSAMTFAALVMAMLAPYLIYVELNGGIWNYFITALDQNRSEEGYDWPNPFVIGAAQESRLLYLFHLLPVVAIGVCAMDWKTRRDRSETLFIISVAFVAVAENFGLIRDVLAVRVRDAIVPAVVIGGWLIYRAWLARPRYPLIASAVVLLYAGFAIGNLGDGITGTLTRAGFSGRIWPEPGLLLDRFAERSGALHDRFGSDSPSRTASVLRPFFSYLDRCTTDQHRLFLGGLIPEVAYLAQRPFAGGGYEHYNFNSRINQQRVVDRLRRQLVPFALIPSATNIDEIVPIVAGHLRRRYVLLADFAVSEDEHIQVLIDATLPPASRDTDTGWPCFK